MTDNRFQKLAFIHPTSVEFECFASLAYVEDSIRQSDEFQEFIGNRRNYLKGDDHSGQDQTGQGQTGQGQAVRKTKQCISQSLHYKPVFIHCAVLADSRIVSHTI